MRDSPTFAGLKNYAREVYMCNMDALFLLYF